MFKPALNGSQVKVFPIDLVEIQVSIVSDEVGHGDGALDCLLRWLGRK